MTSPAPQQPGPRRDPTAVASRPAWRQVPTLAAAMWATVWFVLLATGQRIDLRPVYAGWQNLPVEALRETPLSGVFDLHIQPPLWNLTLGGAIGLSPFNNTFSVGVILVLSGCVLAASVAAVLTRFGLSRKWTLALTAAATLNTHVLVYAFNAGYDLTVAALLGVLMWVVVGTRRPSTAWFGVIIATTAIAMTRSLYHPVWVLAVMVMVGWELRSKLSRRQIAIGVIIPLLTIGGWTVNNGVRHGTWTLSSWTGMNLLRSVYPTVSKQHLNEMYIAGDISGIGLAGPFRAYSAYEPFFGECTPTDRPGLAIRTRPIPAELRAPGRFYSEEAPNFNYQCYIPAYEQAGSDALTIMRLRPGDWAKARIWAADNWFEAPAVVETTRSPLWPVADVLTGVWYIRIPHPPLPNDWYLYDLWVHGSTQTLMVAVNWLAGLIAVCSYGVAAWRRRGGSVIDPAAIRTGLASVDPDFALRRRTLIAVLGVTLAWTVFAGICIELGEQGRFRAVTDPMVLSAIVLMNWRWYSARWRAWRTRRAANGLADDRAH